MGNVRRFATGWFKEEGSKMRKEDCIFCKIAEGTIPSATIYEDDDFRVIFQNKAAAVLLLANLSDGIILVSPCGVLM